MEQNGSNGHKNGNGHKRDEFMGINFASTDLGKIIQILEGMEIYRVLKLCTKCGEFQHISEGFYNNAAKADGRQTYCKTCHNEMVEASRVRKAEKDALLAEIAHQLQSADIDTAKSILELLRGSEVQLPLDLQEGDGE